MAKMMPGYVRQEGLALFEAGKVDIQSVKSEQLLVAVDGLALRYSLNDAAVFCVCDFFKSKGFCAHLAAVEAYLKRDKSGQDVLAQLSQLAVNQAAVATQISRGATFLDSLPDFEPPTDICFALSAEGEVDVRGNGYWWTLKIRRLPDERRYIIRDIKAFLKTLRSGRAYPIGQRYFEPIPMTSFDAASQDLLELLLRMIPDSDDFDVSYFLPHFYRYLYFPEGLFEEGLRCLNQLEAFRLQDGHRELERVAFRQLGEESLLFQFVVKETSKEITLDIREKHFTILFSGKYLLYQGCFYHVDTQIRGLVQAIADLSMYDENSKRLTFLLSDRHRLAAHLQDFSKLGQVMAPSTFKMQDFEANFSFDIRNGAALTFSLSLDLPERKVQTEADLIALPFAINYQKWKSIQGLIAETGFGANFEASLEGAVPSSLSKFFREILPKFERIGSVHLSDELRSYYQVVKPQIQVNLEGGWLDVAFDFSGIEAQDVASALKALENQVSYFEGQQHQVMVFDEESLKMSQTLLELRAKVSSNGHWSLNRLAAFQLLDRFEGHEQVAFSEQFKRLVDDLRHPENFDMAQPSVAADLRDYQLLGVRWLSMLNHYGFGGILADDMGLGKTLQTIAFLQAHLATNGQVLILSPASLIYNWQAEFQRFAPDLEVVVAYGSKSIRDEMIASRKQVIITSYAAFRQDYTQYQQVTFDYLILDEAQVMKNAQTQIAQHLRQFDVKQTFALSGTPIENRLSEIWSIFQIVMPGLLPNKEAFAKMTPEKVARYIKPFVLRRRKEEVLPELPALTEISYFNELADDQKAIYLAQLEQMQLDFRDSNDEEINRRKIEILTGITRLRQICDTPSLFLPDYQGRSGKLDSLKMLLNQLRTNQQRPLIFSQFRGMLDRIEEMIAESNMSSFKLTGSTPATARKQMTDSFNSGEGDAFLISLKAGGLGLNLTGADTVILVDLWWNPALEAQAIGRAHRMGQERHVEFYRLITRGTIEEKILALQAQKKDLVTTVLDGDESRAAMSVVEIREILGLS